MYSKMKSCVNANNSRPDWFNLERDVLHAKPLGLYQ